MQRRIADHESAPCRDHYGTAWASLCALVTKNTWRAMLAALSIFWLASISLMVNATDSYPTRAVRMIVPFVPGGASDFIGRILQPKLAEQLGQQIVIDNRAGAAGNIGVELVARANPDGHTMLLGNVGTMVVNPHLFPKFPVKPLTDLTGITLVADTPGAFAVHASVPGSTVKEFVDYAKSRTGQLNYGSAGTSSATRLLMEIFMASSGTKLVHIPYSGAGAATTALLSGEVSAMMVSPASVIPHMKTGKLKFLAVIAPKRLASVPEVPTFAEVGFPELSRGSWSSIHVPAGTPAPVVRKIHAAVLKVLADPWVAERYTSGGAEVATSASPSDFAMFLRKQHEFWGDVVKRAGVIGE